MSIADKILRAKADYDAVYAAGHEEGYGEGQQAEYDRFWDEHQSINNGGLYISYAYAFAGQSWTDDNFKPKYDIIAEGYTAYMFAGTCITDLKGILETRNVTLDLSKATNLSSFLYDARKVTRLPALDFSSATSLELCIYNCPKLQSIDLIKLNNSGTVALSNFLRGCDELASVRFEGVIGKSINLAKSSKLTTESVQSIIDHLKDLTGATAQTLTFHATVGAALTDAQKAAITAKNWTLVY